MLQAMLDGKLSSSQENMEDILTSCVFGSFKYLAPNLGLGAFLKEARGAMSQSQGEKVAETLENTRDLVRGLESMQERLEDQARKARGGEQQASQGQEGSEGQRGSGGQQQGEGEGEG